MYFWPVYSGYKIYLYLFITIGLGPNLEQCQDVLFSQVPTKLMFFYGQGVSSDLKKHASLQVPPEKKQDDSGKGGLVEGPQVQ